MLKQFLLLLQTKLPIHGATGVAPLHSYAHAEGNCGNSDLPNLKGLLSKDRICSHGSKFFPFKEVPILKLDAIDEIYCSLH